jgi:hypothetical protein
MSQRTVAHIRPHSPGRICKLFTPGGLGLKITHMKEWHKHAFILEFGAVMNRNYYLPPISDTDTGMIFLFPAPLQMH